MEAPKWTKDGEVKAAWDALQAEVEEGRQLAIRRRAAGQETWLTEDERAEAERRLIAAEGALRAQVEAAVAAAEQARTAAAARRRRGAAEAMRGARSCPAGGRQ